MTTLYRVEVGQTLYADGVGTFSQKGETLDVDGQRMVRLPHGVIVNADGWFADAAAARAAAAYRIEQLAQTLLAQAASMRPQEVTA